MNELQALKAEAYDLVREKRALSQYCAMLENALRVATGSKEDRPIREVLQAVEKGQLSRAAKSKPLNKSK